MWWWAAPRGVWSFGYSEEEEGAGPWSEEDCEARLEAAGQTSEEWERLALIEELVIGCPEYAEDLYRLLPTIRMWADPRSTNWKNGSQAIGEEGFLNVDETGVRLSTATVPEAANSVFSANFEMAVYPPRIATNSSVYPLWALYRARCLIWAAVQSGLATDWFFGEARALLGVAAEAYPRNELVAMYRGEAIPGWDECVDVETAPRWANDVHCVLTKLDQLVEYWISERQSPEDGAFGGGWGDDVELIRWWPALSVAFEYKTVTRAWTKLSESVWALDRMRFGYSCLPGDESLDVGHSGEESADTLIAMIRLESLRVRNFSTFDDILADRWLGKAWGIFELFRDRWLAQNRAGSYQFTSTHLDCGLSSSSEEEENPNYACDVPRHLRALEPVVFLYQLLVEACVFRGGGVSDDDDDADSSDSSSCPFTEAIQEMEAPLLRWFDAYVEATAYEGAGCKPAGALPAAFVWPEGATALNGTNWFEPGCHDECAEFVDSGGCDFRVCATSDIFRYPDGHSAFFKALSLIRHLSSNQTYLNPLRDLAKLARSYDLYYQAENAVLEARPDRGTALDVGRRRRGLGQGVAVHRFLQREVDAVSTEFDDEFADLRGTYEHFLLDVAADGAEDASPEHADDALGTLEDLRRALSRHFELLTSEVRYTDRALELADSYLRKYRLVDDDFRVPEADDFVRVYQRLTGDVADSSVGVAPLNAVRWEHVDPRRFAALVLRHTATTFAAQLYSFSSSQAVVVARFLRLVPGAYRATAALYSGHGDDDHDAFEQPYLLDVEFVVDCFGELLCDPAALRLDLPPHRLVFLDVAALDQGRAAALVEHLALAYASPPQDDLSPWTGVLDLEPALYDWQQTPCRDFLDATPQDLDLLLRASQAHEDFCGHGHVGERNESSPP